ncbi:HAD family phosphatase [Prochlorococcus sp. MIT 1307]|uniref:HAD family hydrolase n=1 Tax=Prochlorococcus sp. MIT 1307 TaxID=3096219 RepID=UPI002A75E01A|nr:HAD family phosphatase [Prochlorococcus sp. MIT 1307]
MNLPKACLLDLDGVLLDTEELHSEAWSKAAAIYGTKLSEEQLMLLKGRRRLECAEKIVNWIGKSVTVQDFMNIHKPISTKLMSQTTAISGAEELVKWCFNNKLLMALVTSSARSSVDLKSSSQTWLNLIQIRVNGDDSSLKKGKPAPDPYLLAAKKLNVNPSYCWAVEDSLSGAQSALEAGCKVWILNKKKIYNKNSNRELLNKQTHIKSLSELLDKLKKLKENY